MIITIAGIRRSGSTWLYNAVRLLCEHSQKDVVTHNYVPDFEDMNPETVYIFKMHKFRPAIANRSKIIFTSYRNLPDIKKSLKRCFGSECDLNRMNTMVFHLLRWQQITDYCMHYDSDPYKTFKEVASVLHQKGIECYDIAGTFQKLQSIRPGNEYDPVTLLFPNHISNDNS